MKLNKKGQIVKFHTVKEDEDPKMLYVVLDLAVDGDRPRARIVAINSSLRFPPINVVRLGDLEVVELETWDLIGEVVTVLKDDGFKVLGRVVKVNEAKVWLDLLLQDKGVETNVYLTLIDREGKEQHGRLIVQR